MLKELNPRQQIFADAILAGERVSDAYRKAGYSAKDPVQVSRKAGEVLRAKKVQAYIDANQNILESKKILTRMESLKILAGIARTAKTGDTRIRAIAQASKMQGHDAPQKIEAKVEGSLLWQIRNQ
jgi:phage terminase small subunit